LSFFAPQRTDFPSKSDLCHWNPFTPNH